MSKPMLSPKADSDCSTQENSPSKVLPKLQIPENDFFDDEEQLNRRRQVQSSSYQHSCNPSYLADYGSYSSYPYGSSFGRYSGGMYGGSYYGGLGGEGIDESSVLGQSMKYIDSLGFAVSMLSDISRTIEHNTEGIMRLWMIVKKVLAKLQDSSLNVLLKVSSKFQEFIQKVALLLRSLMNPSLLRVFAKRRSLARLLSIILQVLGAASIVMMLFPQLTKQVLPSNIQRVWRSSECL
eukprot:TRINITY_DN10076_c0_g1_i6.p1 TRINITY_DN10076_c0_g1~~TRINITY_DN10076_c0_g1_i6.p1  ORF type:complete len:237 (-),score=6.25 TRINITY_DN10076_c0_g1_i6:21-731(-)